ncbi:unnamed protein product, partial [Mesorhabditis spiculigera]
PELLNKIHWSDIDQVYRSNREGTRDLAFQLFCSESGFMRYFPAAPWYWDHETDRDVLDLFDCRNSEWYINGATCSKNVLIMLDMSGSMLGQRYEIAKQTTEAILETLSHNDYFNILPFAANPQFLDEECSKQHPMLQATMRNKKYLRALMNNITSEGKAEYDAAIEKAFATLKGLGNTEGITSEYGCESVLALITDGAPEDYHEIFQRYNPKGEIRVFTFLIGEEAIDFEQVRNMACQNRGYMVHIQNMADVEEKIQNYIRVMSRPLGAHDKDIDEKSQVWSGVYRERLYLPRRERFADPAPLTNQSFAQMNRMAAKRKIHMKKAEARSRMFVTTVSYPVLLNKTFMGVAAVNIPLTELGQLAHPTEIGGNSYYFMLDYNGFIMFHPQLRPIDMRTKLHKQNYNNMELLELEVGQNGMMHNVVLNCDNSKPPTLDVLFASDMVCIKDSDFVLGLAVSKGDESRIARRNQNYDYGKVQLSWAEEGHWHIHPYWRYCLLNDTDAGISKEEAFVVYMKQMKKSGKLPELCRARQELPTLHHRNQPKSVEDRYFRRSIRQKDKIVFDINNSSKLWYPMGETKSAYGILENVTLLGQATKAIYKEDALLGVAGLEFDWQHWCVLLDEHGYVVYSNDAATSYKNAYMDLRGGESHLGVFFAHINRVAERAMELLVHRGFYKKYMYYDHQATCLKPKPVTQSGYSLRRPITSIIAYFMRFVNKLLLSAKQLSLFPFFHQFINTAEAFTASFHTAHDGFPCTKETPFYYQQPDDETRSGDLVDGGRAEKPCINTKCAVRMQAHSTKDSMHCYESAHCPLNYPSPVPFIWKSTEHNTTESKCRHDATVMLFITLALGVVVEEVNLHKRIALKMLCWTGTRPNRLLFGFMLITGFMSFFLTDYAATALMLPFAHAVLEAKQHGKQSLQSGVFVDPSKVAKMQEDSHHPDHPVPHLPEQTAPSPDKRRPRTEEGRDQPGLKRAPSNPSAIPSGSDESSPRRNRRLKRRRSHQRSAASAASDASDYMTDATPGIIVLYLMFVWPRYNPWDVRTRTKGEGPEKLLTWSMLQHKLAWSLLFLVGCGFAISTAVKESGLSSQIEDLLKEELSGLDPLLLQLICLLIVVVLTEFVSNSSTASIFVPLFLGAVEYTKQVYSGGLLSVFCVGATMLNMNTWAYWWFNMDEHKWLERAPGNTTLQMPPTPSAHAMSLNGIE